jgi:hypothetical protein
MKTQQVTVDSLKALYLELKDKLIPEQDIKEDITTLFWRGIRQKLEKGERIQIGCTGQTTKGKSTIGMKIKWTIHRIIKEMYEQKIIKKTTYQGQKDEYDLIAANQIEFLRIARRNDIYQVCAQIDEFSKMGESGANATTEQNLMEWYNNVCAQRYIHMVLCTPENDYDKYSILILKIIDVDKQKNITKCRLYYNDPSDQRPYLIGYVTINVEDIIQQPWYKTYRQKKDYAMNLLLQESVKDLRELEFALVSLITYQKCKRLAEVGVKDTDIIGTKADETIREVKAVYSFVSKADVISKVKALITPITEIRRAIKALTKPREKPLDAKTEEDLLEQIKIFKQEHKKLVDYHKQLIQLYLDYTAIGDTQLNRELIANIKQNNIMGT